MTVEVVYCRAAKRTYYRVILRKNEFYGHGAGFSNRIPIHFLWEHCKLRKYAVELLKFNKSNTDDAYAHLPALLLFTLIDTT